MRPDGTLRDGKGLGGCEVNGAVRVEVETGFAGGGSNAAVVEEVEGGGGRGCIVASRFGLDRKSVV